MKVLALEPYYGGSHRAFLDGWIARSIHEWTVIGLPAYKWKWRMRHAAITMAEGVRDRLERGGQWDVLLCSDMLNLAEFLGLAPEAMRAFPTVAYFHENQLTYPNESEHERDYHFAFTNLTTALAARRVWFNSAYHRDSFLHAMDEFLARMPDHQPTHVVDVIRAKSSVQAPGVEGIEPAGARTPGPLRVLWAARWEHDKDPQTFFDALIELTSRGIDFRVSVLGESFETVPSVFDEMRSRLAKHIEVWGYTESREEYLDALRSADIVVSTARHEFFGIAVAEAVAAGTVPLVPRSLAYQELLNLDGDSRADVYFHEGSAADIADRLTAWARRLTAGEDLAEVGQSARRAIARFRWDDRAAEMDAELERLMTEQSDQ